MSMSFLEFYFDYEFSAYQSGDDYDEEELWNKAK